LDKDNKHQYLLFQKSAAKSTTDNKQLTVSMLNGKQLRLALSLNESTTVEEVKNEIQEKLGEDWAPHAQRLVYEGKALQKNDDKLKEAYGVESGATFQLSKSKVQVRLVNASVV
jgi:hypothetical protein